MDQFGVDVIGVDVIGVDVIGVDVTFSGRTGPGWLNNKGLTTSCIRMP